MELEPSGLGIWPSSYSLSALDRFNPASSQGISDIPPPPPPSMDETDPFLGRTSSSQGPAWDTAKLRHAKAN